VTTEGSGRLGGAGIRALQDAFARLPCAGPCGRPRLAGGARRPPPGDHVDERTTRLAQDSNLRQPSYQLGALPTELANGGMAGIEPALLSDPVARGGILPLHLRF
jgi:hypothetical protein